MYRFRFIWIILQSLLTRPKKISDTFDLCFRVVPLIDTDFSRMFTHAYAALMGLARWQYVFGSELRNVALKNKWAPVTTSDTITYKRSVKAFSKVILRTRLICWDERRFYLEHSFIDNGREAVHCYVEGLIRAPGGMMRPGDVFAATGLTEESPPFPEDLKAWIASIQNQSPRTPSPILSP